MPNVPDFGVKKQLTVGISVPQALNLVGIKGNIRGSAFIEGPLDVGTPVFAPGESNVCISRCINPDATPLPLSLVKIRNAPLVPALPTDVIIGDLAGPVGVTVFCGPSFFTVQATAITLLKYCIPILLFFMMKFLQCIQIFQLKYLPVLRVNLVLILTFPLQRNAAPVISPETVETFSDYVSPYGTTLLTTWATALSKKGFDIPHPT
jgi:hypothetical protein